MQHHARLLIQRGVSVAEAKKPHCLRCVQQLLATASRVRDEETVK
jgi:hypothetical protein